MGKSYLFIHSDRKTAILRGNEFARRARAMGRRVRPWAPYTNRAGNTVFTLDVCGSDFRDLDPVAERIMNP